RSVVLSISLNSLRSWSCSSFSVFRMSRGMGALLSWGPPASSLGGGNVVNRRPSVARRVAQHQGPFTAGLVVERRGLVAAIERIAQAGLQRPVAQVALRAQVQRGIAAQGQQVLHVVASPALGDEGGAEPPRAEAAVDIGAPAAPRAPRQQLVVGGRAVVAGI